MSPVSEMEIRSSCWFQLVIYQTKDAVKLDTYIGGKVIKISQTSFLYYFRKEKRKKKKNMLVPEQTRRLRPERGKRGQALPTAQAPHLMRNTL